MKDDKKYMSLEEPQLPEKLKDARRNHGGMTVPNDFFEQFERKMNAVIDAAELKDKPADPEVSLPQVPVFNWRRWVSIAAAVIVLVALSLVIRSQQSAETPTDLQGLASFAQTIDTEEQFELPDHMADEIMAAASDFDVYDLYCDL